MGALLLVAAGGAVVAGSLMPWIKLTVDLGRVAAAGGGNDVATAFLSGFSLSGSVAHGYHTPSGKIVLGLGVVLAVSGVLMLVGAEGPWRGAAVVSGAGAAIVTGVWYVHNHPSSDVAGIGVSPATGMWIVFGAGLAGTAIASLGSPSRR